MIKIQSNVKLWSSIMSDVESLTKTQVRARKRKHANVQKHIKVPGVEEPIDSLTYPLKPEYYIENGLRKVKPYYFNFSCYAKRRWVGKNLIDTLNSELHPRAPIHFASLVKGGRIRVNGKAVDEQYVLRDNDFVENVVHRHEAFVLDQDIKILADTNDFLAVDKPCSIPIHPCGRYRHNSLHMLLYWLSGYKDLRTLYRLDRLTSGLCVFAKNLQSDQTFKRALLDHKVKKQYFSMVEGEFPKEEVVCDIPIATLSKKMGIQYASRTDLERKEACTVFQRMAFNGENSIVKCFPKTGRTHQIRVHLQFLGHPIVNDSLYNSHCFGPFKGKNGEYGKTVEQMAEDLWKAHDSKIWLIDRDNDKSVPSCTLADGATSSTNEENHMDELCYDCKLQFVDPTVEELNMFLHCFSYEGPDWKFETKEPSWIFHDD